MTKAILCASLVLWTVSLSAQQPQPTDLAGALKAQYNSNKRFLIAAAAKMPDDVYNWRPAGLEAELRTFGQILVHIANANHETCSRVTGQPMPKALDDTKGVFTKADATKALMASFAYCDPVYDGITNQNLTDTFKMAGRNNTTQERSRGGQLVSNIAHSNEQYGMVMVYFGMKGMVPPSHEPR
jgi:hypothetical protein